MTTARDRPDGDYVHRCAKCGDWFSGYKGDRFCMLCLPTLLAMVQARDPLADLHDALTALSAVVDAHCDGHGETVLAEDGATVAAVRLLARFGRCEVAREGESWCEARWTDGEKSN